MVIYIPESRNEVIEYKTKQVGIKHLFGVIDDLNQTPIEQWGLEHLEEWAKHLCVFADQRIHNFRYERRRRWRMHNDPVFAHARRARKNSPEGRLRARALRDERLRHATPPWANSAAMQAVYDDAHRLELETGQKHHVDHVFPLVLKDEEGNHIGCGLHWEGNLTPCLATVNLKKGCLYVS